MTTLVLVKLNPINAEKMASYSAQAADTVSAFGGEFLTKGTLAPLHGETAYSKSAVIAFPTAERAVAWYNSPEYQDLIELRDEAMDSQFLVIS